MGLSAILVIFFGFAIMRAINGGGGGWRRRRWEQPTLMLEEKVAKLETLVAELQEQAELDRTALHRLEEERDFLRQLYPPKEETRV